MGLKMRASRAAKHVYTRLHSKLYQGNSSLNEGSSRYSYRSVSGIEEFLEQHRPEAGVFGCSCDLGCGSKMRNPLRATSVIGIDVGGELGESIIKANLILDPIPLESASMSVVTAYDFIEHVPRIISVQGNLRYPFIDLMDEIYRVLKPGGLFFHSTPAYPSPTAFQDPTHVNIITEETFPMYFCKGFSEFMGSDEPAASIYGFKGSFEMIDQAWWCNNVAIITLMRKPA